MFLIDSKNKMINTKCDQIFSYGERVRQTRNGDSWDKQDESNKTSVFIFFQLNALCFLTSFLTIMPSISGMDQWFYDQYSKALFCEYHCLYTFSSWNRAIPSSFFCVIIKGTDLGLWK